MTKKILITGAGGFIGSHTVSEFLKKGYQVNALIKYNSKDFHGWLEGHKHKNLKILSGDITDSFLVDNLVKNNDYIVNLAALIGIPYSYEAVESYYNTNVKGVINLLTSAKRYKISKILLTSTSEVYGSAKYIPINEEHPLHGQSPYSASKIASDQIGEAFAKSYNLPIKIVRPFNAYGPRQSLRAIIPTIVSQILDNKKIIQLGNIDTTRDYNYVEDIATAFLEILENTDKKFDIINICSGKEIKMSELAKKLIKISRKKIKIQSVNTRLRPKNSEVVRLLGDNSKIMKITKWKPKTNFTNGLLKTFNWYKMNYSKKSLFFKSNKYTI